ncbi:MAG TPA: hypothetical protein VFW06_10550 [Acidimicrobiia bacterium]|nr:hypothetical protein [Acidimicrobiia bacterium]
MATMSLNDHRSSSRARKCSGRDSALHPKLCSIPRTHSHGVRWMPVNDTYSGVRTSKCGGFGGTIPAPSVACRRAPASITRRPAFVRARPNNGFHGIQRLFTTPSGFAA